MIKIIKNTMIDPIKIECKCCKSIFSFNYEDIRRVERTSLVSTQVTRFVICPVCKEENPINKIIVNDEIELWCEKHKDMCNDISTCDIGVYKEEENGRTE